MLAAFFVSKAFGAFISIEKTGKKKKRIVFNCKFFSGFSASELAHFFAFVVH